MTPSERAVLDAALALARAARAYNAIIEWPVWSAKDPAYIDAVNAMDDAEAALIAATEPLLE